MPEARIIDGKAFAASLRGRIATAVGELKATRGLVPGLAVLLVGDDPASQVYVRSKQRHVEAAGMSGVDHALPADTPEATLLDLIGRLNADPMVHGILMQLPLPPQIDPTRVIDAIDPLKDVDGFHAINAGRLWTGDGGMVPCTPLGSLMLLKDCLGKLDGREAVVVGRSNIVGKPMAALLLGENCTVTLAHSRTRDLPAVCRRADILVVAAGRPEMVRGDWIRPGATVIDVGINRVPASDRPRGYRIVGDVCFAEARAVAGAITPVPGGVGPMTIACVLRNTLVAACRQAGLPDPALA